MKIPFGPREPLFKPTAISSNAKCAVEEGRWHTDLLCAGGNGSGASGRVIS